MRLLIVLGSGGHTKEMLRVVDLLGPGYDYAYLVAADDELSLQKIRTAGPVFRAVRPRWKTTVLPLVVLRTLWSSVQAMAALVRTRPRAIISTGPGPAVPASLLAKLLGIRVIYIETGSRIFTPSTSGKILYRVADLFFVQWPELLRYSRGPSTPAGCGEMIFVTVGSTDFDGLIEAMDGLAADLDDEMLMQIGLGQYEPKNAQFLRFAPSLESYLRNADVVVAHGGLGTIVEALELGKRLVCVVNPATYDRHQEHLLSTFEEQGYLLWCKDLATLGLAVREARVRQFKPYQPPECYIHEVIARYLRGEKPVVQADPGAQHLNRNA